ncbi:MAG TPA: polysaccharide deacetylase family protein [Gaiellaceae bacterium]|nr:polysaccharide deacetylase family protein [Gaiellaceae bacterium]
MPHNAATRVVLRAAGSFLLLTAGLVAAGELATGEARPSSSRCFVAGCHTTSTQQRLRLPRPLPRRRVAVPILMYHRINVASPGAPAITRRLTVHPADFARQMRWLRRHGYQTVTQRELFDALMHGRPLGRRPIMITFDDGYRDVFYKATPVLTKLGMQGTAYVISNRVVNGDRTFLSPGLLRALEHRGVEIGSHSVSHSDLTQLSDRELLAELMGSRRSLERWLRHPVQWLAYPFGAYDGRVERLARRAGYVLAVTTEEGTLQSAGRPLALQRLRVLDSTGVRGLAALLGDASLP